MTIKRKLLNLFIGKRKIDYNKMVADMQAIQDEAAACKLRLSATSLRIEAVVNNQLEQSKILSDHEERLRKVESRLDRRSLSKTGQYLLDVVADKKPFIGLDKPH